MGSELARTTVRLGSSRILGVALIITSAVLFLVAFVSNFLPFEAASLISFVLGIALLAVELEPRVKLTVAADGMLGYLRTLDVVLRSLKANGKATYVPRGNQVTMALAQGDGAPQIELPPVGAGLHDEIIGELGDMTQKGLEFFNLWIPRVLVDNLSLSDNVRISTDNAALVVSMARPFVRPLCVDPFVNENVCCRMGCPLAGAVAQTLAVSTGREVQFDNCTYDPKTQQARTTLKIGKSV
jgi:hypothetical protein